MIDPDHPRLSIARHCELVSISRASFYRLPAGECGALAGGAAAPDDGRNSAVVPANRFTSRQIITTTDCIIHFTPYFHYLFDNYI